MGTFTDSEQRKMDQDSGRELDAHQRAREAEARPFGPDTGDELSTLRTENKRFRDALEDIRANLLINLTTCRLCSKYKGLPFGGAVHYDDCPSILAKTALEP